ncbi:hypothetical protein PM8797T_14169, partial [Gimesia maris DSM 8797]
MWLQKFRQILNACNVQRVEVIWEQRLLRASVTKQKKPANFWLDGRIV